MTQKERVADHIISLDITIDRGIKYRCRLCGET